jgi:hypothetical protein
MAISLIASTSAASTNSATVTSPAINTTGATLIVVISAAQNSSLTITDSVGNTWSNLTQVSSNGYQQIYYVVNPTTSASHTFSNSTSSYNPTICIMAFSGTATSSAFDQQNTGTQNYGNTVQPGSVTPSVNNEVVITGMSAVNAVGTVTINGSYSAPIGQAFNSGGSFNIAAYMSYLVQTSATATNPTWSFTTTDGAQASIATFKAPSASGTIIPLPWMNTTGGMQDMTGGMHG